MNREKIVSKALEAGEVSLEKAKSFPQMFAVAWLQATRWMIAGIIGGLAFQITLAPLPDLLTLKWLFVALFTGTFMELLLMTAPADDEL